jgi:hypothetical protein
VDPAGKVIDLNPLANPGFIPIGEEDEVPVITYIVPETTQGYYKLTISSDLPKNFLRKVSLSGYPNAVITVVNNDDVVIQTHYSSYLIKQGEKIGIISALREENPSENPIVTTASMEVMTPDGADEDIPMSNVFEGLSKFNYSFNMGVYGAEILAEKAGTYLFQAKLEGYWNSPASVESIPFVRTSQHIITVSAATIQLTGSATISPKDAGHYLVNIGVTGTGDQVRAYAEVWGVDPNTKQPKPACWIGGIVQVVNNAVTLVLDTNWLTLAVVDGPFKLHNVYISDLVTSFPVSISPVESMPVLGSDLIKYKRSSSPITITKEMRFGFNPLYEQYEAARNTTAAPSLITLPGYCSESNPWQGSHGTFTNCGFFSMKKGNYGHHEFALKALDYFQASQSPSFSLIGHSQGGAVAAHLYNFWSTGLDNAKGGRLIQTVGTPFQGCTAAGGLADLGPIFGIGCGSNTDLSRDGAVNWLSSISPEVRAAIHFYTTTYEQGSFFGDYCNLAINTILQWPNDGTTELVYAPMPGGVNMGNIQKQCHTTSMKYKAQYQDASRNSIMNQNAAR